MIPYVYLIGWTKLDRWYIGCRHAKNCHPSELWKPYFTSSDIVKAFREEHGEPDSFKILNEFSTGEEALAFEEEKQKEYDVLNDEKWLNANIGGKKFYCTTAWIGKKHSEESKIKISISQIGKKLSEETKRKIRESMKGKNRGPQSKEHRQKLSNSMKGEKGPWYGKTRSEETKRKIKETYRLKKTYPNLFKSFFLNFCSSSRSAIEAFFLLIAAVILLHEEKSRSFSSRKN